MEKFKKALENVNKVIELVNQIKQLNNETVKLLEDEVAVSNNKITYQDLEYLQNDKEGALLNTEFLNDIQTKLEVLVASQHKDWKIGDKTGFKDIDGKDILVGNYYKNLKNKIGTIYQIRIRDNTPVVHWGGAYMKLNKDIASHLKLIENKNVSLGSGAEFFNSKIID